jgi:hypothetical protein
MEAIMQKLALAVGVFVLLTLGLYTVVVPDNAIAQNIACYRMQGGAKNVAASGCEYEFRSGSTLDIQDGTTFSISDLTLTDDLIVTDDLTVGGWYSATKQTTIVVSDGSTITPLGTYAPISATATTGTSSIANPTAGRVLLIVNVGSATITLTDTGTLKLSGNAALGQFDTLSLLGDGTNWVEISETNN